MTNDLNSWGRLDLTGADTDLPPGDYDATIIKADVFARSDNLWFAVETALTDSGYIPPAQIVALGARGDSPTQKACCRWLTPYQPTFKSYRSVSS